MRMRSVAFACAAFALAVAASAATGVSATQSFNPYPAAFNPPLTPEQQQRVDSYASRYPHFHATPRTNPCRAVCASTPEAAASAECSLCCRTARHRVPWNCPVDSGAHGDPTPRPDAHNGAAAKCCDANTWTAECWALPSADNYYHSCDMCGAPRHYNPQNTGCDGYYTTSACWNEGGPPIDGLGETGNIEGPVIVPSGYRTNIPANISVSWNVQGGANVTLQAGAVVGLGNLAITDPQPLPVLITALGNGERQLVAKLTQMTAVNPFVVLAPRNAIIDLGQMAAQWESTIRIDSTYIPEVVGTVPPPPPPPSVGLRYRSPRYRGAVLIQSSGSGSTTNARIEVVGDSGVVTVAFSIGLSAGLSRQPFPGTVLVDGTKGAKLVLVGQSADTYRSVMDEQGYHPFSAGESGSPMRLVLNNGGAVAFGAGAKLDFVTAQIAVAGTNPLSVEFLRGANVSAGVDLTGLNGAVNGSVVIVDGVSNADLSLSPSAQLSALNRYTCAGNGCYSGTIGFGGVCQPASATCTGTSCAGACTCGTSTPAIFASAYSTQQTCAYETCTGNSVCLGGATCSGHNTCNGACPATTAAHFSSARQAQDGTCTPACTGAGALCGVGTNTCVVPGTSTGSGAGAESSTGINAAPGRASPLGVGAALAFAAVAAVLMA